MHKAEAYFIQQEFASRSDGPSHRIWWAQDRWPVKVLQVEIVLRDTATIDTLDASIVLQAPDRAVVEQHWHGLVRSVCDAGDTTAINTWLDGHLGDPAAQCTIGGMRFISMASGNTMGRLIITGAP